MGISFLFPFAFLFSSQLFLRSPQTALLPFETVCEEDPEQLLEYLGTVGHPVLGMEPFDM